MMTRTGFCKIHFEEVEMTRFVSGLTVMALIIAANIAFGSRASADSWGCSYDKCIQACTKASGKLCSKYCDDQLRDKKLAKKCP
jgi:hypothetical protein